MKRDNMQTKELNSTFSAFGNWAVLRLYWNLTSFSSATHVVHYKHTKLTLSFDTMGVMAAPVWNEEIFPGIHFVWKQEQIIGSKCTFFKKRNMISTCTGERCTWKIFVAPVKRNIRWLSNDNEISLFLFDHIYQMPVD